MAKKTSGKNSVEGVPLPREAEAIYRRLQALPRVRTVTEVGRILGIRPQTVHVLERRALRKIAKRASEMMRLERLRWEA